MASPTIDDIQSKPGRLVAIVSKVYGDGISHEPWGIEATWDIKDWTVDLAKSKQTRFPSGTIGTDVKGPFLLPHMRERPKAYPKPFVHLVLVGESKYYISDTFLVDGYTYLREHQKTSDILGLIGTNSLGFELY